MFYRNTLRHSSLSDKKSEEFLSLPWWGLFLGKSNPRHFWSALLVTTCVSIGREEHDHRKRRSLGWQELPHDDAEPSPRQLAKPLVLQTTPTERCSTLTESQKRKWERKLPWNSLLDHNSIWSLWAEVSILQATPKLLPTNGAQTFSIYIHIKPEREIGKGF